MPGSKNKPSFRVGRVSDVIMRELSVLLRTEAKDPRFKVLSITAVKVTADLAYATIFISSYTDIVGDERESVMKALARASGYFRSKLASGVQLRRVPELRFKYDESAATGAYMDGLIRDVMKNTPSDDASDDNESESDEAK